MGTFTLTETGADTETETDKIATILNGTVVSVQCEHLHTILYNLFFIGLCIGLDLSQWERNAPLRNSVLFKFLN